jgi:hypothetical protein
MAHPYYVVIGVGVVLLGINALRRNRIAGRRRRAANDEGSTLYYADGTTGSSLWPERGDGDNAQPADSCATDAAAPAGGDGDTSSSDSCDSGGSDGGGSD